MSLVIAIKDKKNNCIVMGCDSQATYNNLIFKTEKSNSKIWDVKNCPNAIMGGVGSLRNNQIIQFQQNLIEPSNIQNNTVDLDYCVLKLFNKIKNCLQNQGIYNYDEKGNIKPYIEGSFIFSYKNNMYRFFPSGDVITGDDYLVMGCGEQIATGILEMNKDKEPIERIKETIKLVSKKDCFIDDNIIIKSTI